MQQEINLNYC